MSMACFSLSQLGSELLPEHSQEFIHNGIHSLVCQGLLRILQIEADSVLLLALRNLVSGIDIEEDNVLEELFF